MNYYKYLKFFGNKIKHRLFLITRFINKKQFKPYIKNLSIGRYNFNFKYFSIEGREWYDPLKPYTKLELIYASDTFLKPGMTVIDVGAHHGLYALYYSRAVGSQGVVHSFEPHPDNLYIIKNNIKLNDLKNVILHSNAASNKSERLYITSQTNSNITYTTGRDNMLVNAVKLDDVIDNADYIKIDVEGHELSVLEGAKNLLSKKTPVMIEIHPALLRKKNISYYAVISFMRDLGYQIFILDRNLNKVIKWDNRKLLQHENFFFKSK